MPTLARIERLSLNILLTCALACWGALTVAQQTTRGKRLTSRIDPTGAFIPVWTFFGPTPGTIDYEILFRDKLVDGTLTTWSQLQIYEERTVWNMFFDPHRRFSKSIFDAAQELQVLAKRESADESVHLTLPYLILLRHIVKEAPHHLDAREVQFLVVISPGRDIDSEEPTPTFASNFHRLNGIGEP